MPFATVQARLIAALHALEPHQPTLVKLLAEVLALHPRAVYKRLQSETLFTAEEIAQLAQQLRLDVASLFGQSAETIGFRAPWLSQKPASPSAFLQGLVRQMEWMNALPTPSLYYATNDYPLFLGAYWPQLLKFKLFLWGRFIWQWPGYEYQPFRLDDADFAEVPELARTVQGLYEAIPSVEFWSPTLLDHTLSQLRYLDNSRGWQSEQHRDILWREVRELVEVGNRMAATGRKGRQGQGADFQLYRTDLMNHGVTAMVQWTGGQRVFTAIDSPNSLYTDDAVFTAHVAQWFRRLTHTAVPLAGSNESERRVFFTKVKQRLAEGGVAG